MQFDGEKMTLTMDPKSAFDRMVFFMIQAMGEVQVRDIEYAIEKAVSEDWSDATQEPTTYAYFVSILSRLGARELVSGAPAVQPQTPEAPKPAPAPAPQFDADGLPVVPAGTAPADLEVPLLSGLLAHPKHKQLAKAVRYDADDNRLVVVCELLPDDADQIRAYGGVDTVYVLRHRDAAGQAECDRHRKSCAHCADFLSTRWSALLDRVVTTCWSKGYHAPVDEALDNGVRVRFVYLKEDKKTPWRPENAPAARPGAAAAQDFRKWYGTEPWFKSVRFDETSQHLVVTTTLEPTTSKVVTTTGPAAVPGYPVVYLSDGADSAGTRAAGDYHKMRKGGHWYLGSYWHAPTARIRVCMTARSTVSSYEGCVQKTGVPIGTPEQAAAELTFRYGSHPWYAGAYVDPNNPNGAVLAYHPDKEQTDRPEVLFEKLFPARVVAHQELRRDQEVAGYRRDYEKRDWFVSAGFESEVGDVVVRYRRGKGISPYKDETVYRGGVKFVYRPVETGEDFVKAALAAVPDNAVTVKWNETDKVVDVVLYSDLVGGLAGSQKKFTTPWNNPYTVRYAAIERDPASYRKEFEDVHKEYPWYGGSVWVEKEKRLAVTVYRGLGFDHAPSGSKRKNARGAWYDIVYLFADRPAPQPQPAAEPAAETKPEPATEPKPEPKSEPKAVPATAQACVDRYVWLHRGERWLGAVDWDHDTGTVRVTVYANRGFSPTANYSGSWKTDKGVSFTTTYRVVTPTAAELMVLNDIRERGHAGFCNAHYDQASGCWVVGIEREYFGDGHLVRTANTTMNGLSYSVIFRPVG